jgi:NADPH-dependent 2,4-dienoyl-CoA reductase/sulfur reductase-like enzyme
MAPKQRLVVIGAVAAGTSAAAKAKRSDPDLEVILLERGAHISYGACGLPYFIAGLIPSADALLNRTPEEFRQRGVDVRTQQDVLQIDVANQNLRVADLVNAQEYLLPYDYLVVATGAVPMRLPLPGLDLPGVFTLRTLADGVALKAALQTKAPKSVVIVGGGYVGLEMAEAFRALDLPVTIVESMPQLMVTLDEDMSELVLAEVEHNGARVLLNDGLVRCEGSDHLEKVVTQHSEIPADLVLLAVGVRPNSSLAEQAGIQLGAREAISVDAHLRTSVEGVYAAGDCVDTVHQVTGQKTYIPLGSTANKQGRAAGANVAGLGDTFDGAVGTAVAKVFGLQVARTGLTHKEAAAAGFAVHSEAITTKSRAHYYPGAARLVVKLIMDRESRRLLGAQLIGEEGAAKRIDVLAAAIYGRMTVDDLTRLDYSYAPPYASVWDPTLRAANVVGRLG